MHFSTLFAGLAAASAVGPAAAASMIHHQHHHRHASPKAEVPMALHRRAHLESREAKLAERSSHLEARHADRLTTMGVQSGKNDCENNGGVWIGDDGPFTNTFYNNADEDLIVVIWKESWVNANQPWITTTLKKKQSKTVSFENGQSGGWAAIYHDTNLDMGQVCNTWGEYTMDSQWGTVDVSREVNMNGHHMRIHTPNCVSSMDQCVFVCPEGQTSCWQQYELHNCETGSQPGASYGADPFTGMPSGGCTSFGDNPHLRTVFGK